MFRTTVSDLCRLASKRISHQSFSKGLPSFFRGTSLQVAGNNHVQYFSSRFSHLILLYQVCPIILTYGLANTVDVRTVAETSFCKCRTDNNRKGDNDITYDCCVEVSGFDDTSNLHYSSTHHRVCHFMF
jgi:hypothetical protein